MHNYLSLMRKILTEGEARTDRTGVGTISLFGERLEFDHREGFPLITTKKLHIKSILNELEWIISGSTNIRLLKENNVTIWNEWADDSGEIGESYGRMWRNFPGEDGTSYDQLAEAEKLIREDPQSRRILISAWHPARQIGIVKLPPCHYAFQFYVSMDGWLDIQVHMRSADYFLGVPFNIASYGTLLHAMAACTGNKPRKQIMTFGDIHIYQNHTQQAELQLSREPYPKPTLVFSKKRSHITEFKATDIMFDNYQYHPIIKALVAV